ncbi:MAG: dihydropteroate synthase [Bacteroidetes bacterium]|nr:dihydropteroate synthase [Bacteroidota bacterium]MCW5897271.1 dihydropteroate synthase [Bacteroidota bacterium]
MSDPYIFTFGKREYNLSSRTHIMGVLNVTPDSFSDGGKYFNVDAAVDHGMAMIDEGADMIDVGGESTRPKGSVYGSGAEEVDVEEELRRILPVVARLAKLTNVPISVDTYKSRVAMQALDAGAVIVNDISGLTIDREMAGAVGSRKGSLILMHIKGTPKTMQENPVYGNLFGEIADFLSTGIETARRAGITQILIDPGIGFGKTVEHNLQLVKDIGKLKGLGCPIVIGASRKNFIGKILNVPIDERLEGSLAAAVAASWNGAQVVRVHDVKETKRALMIADAIRNA